MCQSWPRRVYLGLLHNLLRFDGRDPFQMMGVILNLSDGELSHAVHWPVPLKKKTSEAPSTASPADFERSLTAAGG